MTDNQRMSEIEKRLKKKVNEALGVEEKEEEKPLTEEQKMIQLLKKINIGLITLTPDVEFSKEYYLNACLNLGGDFHMFIRRIHEQSNLIMDNIENKYGISLTNEEKQELEKIRQIYINIGLFLQHYLIVNGIK